MYLQFADAMHGPLLNGLAGDQTDGKSKTRLPPKVDGTNDTCLRRRRFWPSKAGSKLQQETKDRDCDYHSGQPLVERRQPNGRRRRFSRCLRNLAGDE